MEPNQTTAPEWAVALAEDVPDVNGTPFIEVLTDHYADLIAYEAAHGDFVPTGLLTDARRAAEVLGTDHLNLGRIDGPPEIERHDGAFVLVYETLNGHPHLREHDDQYGCDEGPSCDCVGCLEDRLDGLESCLGEFANEEGSLNYPQIRFTLPETLASDYHGLSIQTVLALDTLHDARTEAQRTGVAWAFLPTDATREDEADNLSAQVWTFNRRRTEASATVADLRRQLDGVTVPSTQPAVRFEIRTGPRGGDRRSVPMALPTTMDLAQRAIATTNQTITTVTSDLSDMRAALASGVLIGAAQRLIEAEAAHLEQRLASAHNTLDRDTYRRDALAWTLSNRLATASAEASAAEARHIEAMHRYRVAANPAWLTWPGTREQFDLFATDHHLEVF